VQINNNRQLSLKATHNIYNLQQLYIDSKDTHISDNFSTSVSAHGGLVHQVMKVQPVTVESITSLVRNSPKLITLHLSVGIIQHVDRYVRTFNNAIKKMFCRRKLFSSGHFIVYLGSRGSLSDILWQQGVDRFPVWN